MPGQEEGRLSAPVEAQELLQQEEKEQTLPKEQKQGPSSGNGTCGRGTTESLGYRRTHRQIGGTGGGR